jgi:uncharacterized heparinase superfamily protein
MLASKLWLYYHTLRHLKFRQIYWRIWYKFALTRVDLSDCHGLRKAQGRWQPPARRRPSLLNSDTFNFLNQTGRLSEIGWEGLQREKLWRYNQHYFDDLNASDTHTRSGWHQSLLSRWIEENAPGYGTGWEPYPSSLRIVNWVKWQFGGNSLPDRCLRSLAIQTRWLAKRLEWHILGNHLFANAKALVFAGLFFDNSEAQKWLNTGLKIIAQEVPEQVLPDGGNFERSPMYHAIFLEDLLDLINLTDRYPGVIRKEHAEQWRATASKMLKWLAAMCHPDGEIAFFNDAAIGISPSPAEIKDYACRLGIFLQPPTDFKSNFTVTQFSDSGYIRLGSTKAVGLLDVAPIGPDYLPGHAHADSLSFELSLFGQRVLVNGGTSQYGSGAIRIEERSTSAHNTVEVNGENSSEVWSGFRVARRAYPIGLKVEKNNGSVSVICAHDGYMRLSGSPIHQRTWIFSNGKILIRDRIDGVFKSAIARFHIHPDIQVTPLGHCRWNLNLPSCNQEVHISVLNSAGSIEKSFHSPEFGIRLQSQCLVVRLDSAKDIAIEILWGIHD